MKTHTLLSVLSILSVLSHGATAADLSPADREFFESKVRPVLSGQCYDCHSVEKGKSKGGLTLDTREGWQKGGQSGQVIVPGQPAESLLVKAVTHEDPDMAMPPKGPKLSDGEIAALTEWVQRGAPDPREKTTDGKLSGLNDKARAHWAYQPVKNPPVPEVTTPDWARNEIDRFVLAALESAGLAPNPAATRQTLIRRAYFDMTGLPPSPQQVLDFVRDESPDAWEKVVDGLLASPAYGERWARHWLDTARYSDTTGGDRKVRQDYRYAHAWTYRDWVIKALNADKPYDRFLYEQIAADALPEAARGPHNEALAALGFLTVGQRFPMQNDVINDRIDVVTKGCLAMTVSCARCHDHKTDPIPTADYYSLHGIFASTLEPRDRPLLADAKGADFADYQKKLAELEATNRRIFYREMGSRLRDFCDNATPLLMMTADLRGNFRKAGKKGMDAAQRQALIKKNKLEPDTVRTFLQTVRRGNLLQSDVLWPWRAFTELPKANFPARAKVLAAQVASDTTRRPVHPLVKKAFAGAQPESLQDVAAIYGRLFAEAKPQVAKLLDALNASSDGQLRGIDAATASLLQAIASLPTADVLDAEEIRERTARWQPKELIRAGFVFAKINELDLTHPGAPPKAMAVVDAKVPSNSPVLLRGQVETKGDVVPRRFLEVLAGPERKNFTQGSGRAELAAAIVDPGNPLTARVAVNRVWMHHFGEGFVPTPDDFGTASEPPSHPELLDWLATRFVADGWSLKKLHKLILTSAAWQQSSDTRAEAEKADPRNRLLWRANIRRLDFESVRDSLLQVSGKLDPTMFGQPVNITDEPYSYRRSVYGYIDRGNLPDLLQNFDVSDPDMPNTRRATTVVPQQALFLMNSAMAVDVARKLVDRPEFTAARDDVGRIRALYEVLFQRWPKADEVRLAQQFIMDRSTQSESPAAANGKKADIDPSKLTPEERRKLRREGKLPPPKKQIADAAKKKRNAERAPITNDGDKVDRTRLDAWEQYAQALLLVNEFAYVN